MPTPRFGGGKGRGTDTLDGTRRAVLAEVAKRSSSSVAMVAAAVGGHANTTRHNLAALLRDGLVTRSQQVTGSAGRPSMLYAVTAAGRAALGRSSAVDEPMSDEYRGLATAFTTYLAAKPDPGPEAREVGRIWGAELARRTRRRHGSATRGMIALLDRLGFSPSVVAAPSNSSAAGATDVRLQTCPLLELAHAHPDVVCQVHHGVISGALDEYSAPGEPIASATLIPFARPGACDLAIRAIQPTAERSAATRPRRT